MRETMNRVGNGYRRATVPPPLPAADALLCGLRYVTPAAIIAALWCAVWLWAIVSVTFLLGGGHP